LVLNKIILFSQFYLILNYFLKFFLIFNTIHRINFKDIFINLFLKFLNLYLIIYEDVREGIFVRKIDNIKKFKKKIFEIFIKYLILYSINN
jgi:hypothetical protein